MCTQRFCLSCNEELTGRADKKYCDDECRNNYHNSSNRDQTNLMRNINNTLRRNRMILERFYTQGKTKVHRSKLSDSGFKFAYFTNLYRTRSGKTYNFCYEKGILPLDNEFFAIVQRGEYVD